MNPTTAPTPGHLPTESDIESWPEFTAESPLRVLVSACLLGVACGVDGSSYGAPYPRTQELLERPDVTSFAFCPEDVAFGTPRATPDIHGGNGSDVLDGRARVISDSGQDWTEAILESAQAMLELAHRHRVHLALLTDTSAACGSQVIYFGPRSRGVHQAGQGVCAALLIRNGIKVMSQRDYRTLSRVLHKLDPTVPLDPKARDHHESEWYLAHLGPER